MLWRAAFIMLLMLAVSIGAATVTPSPAKESYAAPALNDMLPDEFGEWRRMPLASPVLPQETELKAGEAVAYRAYRDRLGRVVTLVVAYGPPLGDSVRLHRPEVCYRAQGFDVESSAISMLGGSADDISVVHLQTRNTLRSEAVTYWLRYGARYSTANSLASALSGRSDGALVRVSSTGRGATEFNMHKGFLRSFYDALEPSARELLTVTAL